MRPLLQWSWLLVRGRHVGRAVKGCTDRSLNGWGKLEWVELNLATSQSRKWLYRGTLSQVSWSLGEKAGQWAWKAGVAVKILAPETLPDIVDLQVAQPDWSVCAHAHTYRHIHTHTYTQRLSLWPGTDPRYSSKLRSWELFDLEEI